MSDYTGTTYNTESERLNFLPTSKTIQKTKVLIIDSDSFYAGKIKTFLECNNYEVFHSSSGCNGIYNSIIHKPDIILTEVCLPDVDGFNIQRELNRYKSFIHSKFVYMSSYSLSFFMREAMDLGAEKFLSKPLDYNELLKVLDAISMKEVSTLAKREEDWNFTEGTLSNNAFIPNEISLSLDDLMQSGFRFVNPNKVEINFKSSSSSLRESSPEVQVPVDPFSINRDELKDFENFNFGDLTLIIVNKNAANQKEAVAFRDFLFPIISQNPKNVLIDLSQITYLDSAFTGVLVEATKRFKLYSCNEIRLVIDVNNSTINPFIVEWIKRNFKTYDNLNFAVSRINNPGAAA